jgi:hypothetical protein
LVLYPKIRPKSMEQVSLRGDLCEFGPLGLLSCS